MPLFDFTCKNLEKTLEFNNMYSWFYLTDGCYNVCINGKRLLSYNPDIWTAEEQIGAKQYRLENGLPLYEPDYYIVRLYEDVLTEALPYVWHNVSDLMHACLLNPKVYDLSWEQWFDKLCDYDKGMDCALRHGDLGGGQMKSPVFRVWRYADEIYLYWDGNETDGEGVAWFQHRGEAVFVMGVAEFIREVEDFHQRLMATMAERIQEVQTRYPNDYHGMILNHQEILKEHRHRQGSLSRAMQHQQLIYPNFEQGNLAAGIDLRKMLVENDYPIEIIRVNHF